MLRKIEKKIYRTIFPDHNCLDDIRSRVRYRRLLQDKDYQQLRKEAVKAAPDISLIAPFVDMDAASTLWPREFYDAIINDRIECKKENWTEADSALPIVVCTVKNDLLKVKAQMRHFRALGVKNIAYIDNCSDDGTYEWLSGQNDVDLFQVKSKYTALRRSAWVRKVTDRYGYDRWYLICDSDELFVYPDCEKSGIADYIAFLEKNKKTSVCAMMLDMYSNGEIINDISQEDMLKKYIYFDSDTYTQTEEAGRVAIRGGPRKRVFGTNNLLAKYPLVKLRRDDYYCYHDVYRKSDEIDKKLHAVLLHYKFLSDDYEKYQKIVMEGNYAGGSYEYKQYMKALAENEHATFYYDGSKKWTDSSSMFEINIFDRELYEA